MIEAALLKGKVKKPQQDDEEEEKLLNCGGERSQSLYCRSSDCEKAELEDFQLIKVIGQGSFGKVTI